MKRYHVIGIAVLVGFIMGVAAPAKAEIENSFVLQCANGSQAINYSAVNLANAHAVTKEFQHFISYRGDLFAFAGVITKEGYHYQSTTDRDLVLVVARDSGVTTYNILKRGEIVDSSMCVA
ncbi:hypothetical protein ATY61_004601 [Salmonella enterica subsp. enterica serovar Saintpaul]|nr:hypothetical protein [Salmonella enterica subsp. enterica serovar Saintpaul]